MNSENEKKKAYLRRYLDNTRRVHRIMLEIEEIRSLQVSPSVNNDGMPHGKGNSSDLSNYLVRLQEKEESLVKAKEEQLKTYIEISEKINKIRDKDENDVLFYRYIKGLRWFEIAREMHCCESWIYKLHGRGLKNIVLVEKASL